MTTSNSDMSNDIYPADKYQPPTYTESGWVILNMRKPYKWSNCLVNLFDRITCGWLTSYHNKITAIAQPPNGWCGTKVLVGNVFQDEIVSAPNEYRLDIRTDRPLTAVLVNVINPVYGDEDSSSSEDEIGDDDVFGSTYSVDSGVEGCTR